jgi:hypothetical protein
MQGQDLALPLGRELETRREALDQQKARDG